MAIIKTLRSSLKKGIERIKKNWAMDEAKIDKENKLVELEKKFKEEQAALYGGLLRRFDYYQIVSLGRISGVPDMKKITSIGGRGYVYEKKVKREFDDYVTEIPAHIDFNEALIFAEKRGVRDIYDVQKESERISYLFQEEVAKIEEEFKRKIKEIGGQLTPTDKSEEKDQQAMEDNKKQLFKFVVEQIKAFEPPRLLREFEVNYQLMLFGYLQRDFPTVQLEEQRGSSRPDLSIGNIGIEIKGPTTYQDLQTIADKLLRYPHWFENGIIITLFQIKVPERFYNEWINGLKINYPNVVIIRK